jgi:hypothetical protein
MRAVLKSSQLQMVLSLILLVSLTQQSHDCRFVEIPLQAHRDKLTPSKVSDYTFEVLPHTLSV